MTEANTVSLQVNAIHTTFQEPTWLAEKRESAWRAFEAAAEPRLEKTDLRKRGFEVGSLSAKAASLDETVKAYVDQVEHPVIVFSDGHLTEVRLPEAIRNQGVIFTDIHTAAKEHEQLVKEHFGTVVDTTEKWEALNQAVFAGGAFVYVPRNVQLEETLEIVHVYSSQSQGSYPRSLVIADELSSVNVAEVSFIAADRPKVTSSHVMEVVAKASSQVHVATAEELHKGPTYFITRRSQVGKDARVEWTVTDVSDGFAVELVENVLKGTGAFGQTRVLGVEFGRAHLDLTASMVHVGRNTESDIVMHAALRDRANSIFRSRTQIIKGAVGAGSEQHDRMIMIDGTARADAIPMLLIDENDVNRCGHAASVGKIDPTQVYYLMSRGIPEAQAMKMIIWGYLRESVESLPTKALQELVVKRVERELSR